MKVEDVKIPEELVRFFREKGIAELYPPQEQAILAGLLEGKSLVVSSPTACYDAQTEVLTKDGWKFFKDTAPNEMVLSMNPRTFKMEHVRAVERIEQDYTGRMVSVRGKEIDFRVTENHNMFVSSVNDPRRMSSSRHSGRPPVSYTFRPAIGITRAWRFKSNGTWMGRRKPFFVLPPVKARRKGQRHAGSSLPFAKIPMEDWLDFLGWYLAQGNTRRRGSSYEVTLCQAKRPGLARRSMVRLGLGKVYTTGRRGHLHFSITDPQLGQYLSRYGLAHEN